MRWEDDLSGRGVGDATAFVEGAEELVGAMREREWVAEEPDVHLLPHLEAAAHELPFELVAATVREDASYDVELRWRGEWGVGVVRQSVFALLGSVAESATYVRQRRRNGGLVFEIVTGLIGEDVEFDSHGHTIRFLVSVTQRPSKR